MTKIEDKSTINHQLSPSGAVAMAVRAHAALLLYHRDGVKVVPLHENVPLVVGRAWPADVVVPDLSLSRKHARFTWTREGLEVEDLGSTNGTSVRGELVENARIPPGEAIQLGAVTVSANVAGAAQLRGIDGHEQFLRRLQEEVLRCRTFKRPLGLLMVRSLSQEEGNASRWVPRVRSELRPVDHMCLYGPFAVLVALPETDGEEAERVARGLVGTGRLGEPPLVCGMALYPEAATSHELIDAARQACRKATPSQPVHISAKSEAEEVEQGRGVVIASPRMREVYDLVRRVATSSIPILILGETGSGKEVVARAIHQASPRREHPMRTINCGAIPATLIESVLFGHEKGAFTGAERSAPGIFEQADGGTVMLDEVGELSQAAQAALLRVLETKRVTRVGGSDEREVDVRVIAATHRDLEKMVEGGAFRMDLLYRLNTMVMKVPPLRDRPEDVDPLSDLFLKEASQANGSGITRIDDAARRLLRTYAWPGNVRELRNEIERAVVICRGDVIGVEDLSERIRGPATPAPDGKPTAMPPAIQDVDFKDRIRHYETELILDALRRCEGNQTQAARMLRMPLRTLVHKIKSYGIKKLYDT